MTDRNMSWKRFAVNPPVLSSEFNIPPQNLFSNQKERPCVVSGNILKTYSLRDPIWKHVWEISWTVMHRAGGKSAWCERVLCWTASVQLSQEKKNKKQIFPKLHSVYVMILYAASWHGSQGSRFPKWNNMFSPQHKWDDVHVMCLFYCLLLLGFTGYIVGSEKEFSPL